MWLQSIFFNGKKQSYCEKINAHTPAERTLDNVLYQLKFNEIQKQDSRTLSFISSHIVYIDV